MNLFQSLLLYFGGPGSGCKGDRCGRKSKGGSRSKKPGRGFLNFVDYDPDLRTMTLTFPGGKRYAYYNVSPKKWENMQYTKKPAAYFYHAIRKKHPFEKLGVAA